MNLTPFLSKSVPPSREDFAYDAIKEAILSGELRPSQKISLTDLAKNLSVSIIPVNNAVRRLTSEGLIRQDPHHSPCVEEFSSEATNEILLIRQTLEALALQYAIPNIDEEGIAMLYTYNDQMQECVQKEDFHGYGKINRSFHMVIYEYSKLPMLCSMIDDLWNKAELNRSRSVFSLVPNILAHSSEEHFELIKIIERRDVSAALELLHQHKEYSRAKLLEFLKKQDAEA